MDVVYRRLSDLKPRSNNPRTHSKRQLRQIVRSIERFGFNQPILIDDQDGVIAGHGRLAAAKQLNLETAPTIRLSHLSEADIRAFVIADNKLALEAGWDREVLAIELQGLIDLDYDATLTGFSLAEVDLALDAAKDASVDSPPGPEDDIPSMGDTAVCRPGEAWKLGRHRLVCGDARQPADYQAVLDGRLADLAFSDPPYNVEIDGHVCGLGRVRHREFAMGAGEMSEDEFKGFLRLTLMNMASNCRNGAIAYVCMDWRHLRELLAVAPEVFSEMKNLCVWNKTNGGMGTFYRSKHELISVFKVGDARHTNTFGLGDTGRYRTNVWDYPGISSFGAGRDEALAMHPTVKPTALVADAIRDCTRRGEIVLDPFAGSGTTLIAAETCGRVARVIEYDPFYCDVIIRRFERLTGKRAIREADQSTFEDAAELSGVQV